MNVQDLLKHISLNKSVDCKDMTRITEKQRLCAQKAIFRIVSGNTKLEDIQPLDDMNIPGCYRWKPTHADRNLCGNEIRVIYRPTPQGIEVIAVGEREGIYTEARKRVLAMK